MADIEQQARIVLEAASIEVRIGHFRADCDVPALARAVLERGEVLRAIEWIEDDRGNEVCPSCQNWRIFGHDHDCALAKALRGDGNG